MSDLLKSVFTMDKKAQWFFITVGVGFTGLCGYFWLFGGGSLPADLKEMTLTAWGAIGVAIAKAVQQLEKVTDKDIDGDGLVAGKVFVEPVQAPADPINIDIPPASAQPVASSGPLYGPPA